MITISPVYSKWKIIFSNPGSGERGFSIMVGTIEEIHLSIDHYLVKPHDKSKCPLCKEAT